jgi:hypothetical protein
VSVVIAKYSCYARLVGISEAAVERYLCECLRLARLTVTQTMLVIHTDNLRYRLLKAYKARYHRRKREGLSNLGTLETPRGRGVAGPSRCDEVAQLSNSLDRIPTSRMGSLDLVPHTRVGSRTGQASVPALQTRYRLSTSTPALLWKLLTTLVSSTGTTPSLTQIA